MSAEDLARDLHRVADDLRDLSEPKREALELLAERGSVEAPRRSGRLGRSVRPTWDQVVVEAPYGGVIHNGWPARHIRANPFLQRAADVVDWSEPFTAYVQDSMSSRLSNSY
jgi:hypothetical protein